MKNKFIYVTTNKEFWNTGYVKNPVMFDDHKLKDLYPEFYILDYDTKLFVTKAPTKQEREFWFYNDILDRCGETDIRTLNSDIAQNGGKNIMLNGFDQMHFDYIAPLIKDSAEVIYFFKCPKINDMSALAEFKKLKCVLGYWNNSLESLWDMSKNTELKVFSFLTILKLKNIDSIKDSSLEYLTLDGYRISNTANKMMFDKSVLDSLPSLKHLNLCYPNCKIDY